MQKDFENLIGQGEQAQGVMEAHQERGHWVYGREEKKKEEENEVGERLLVLMCARIKHGGKVCKNQA